MQPIELNELPAEASLFRNALETKDPIRIIVGADFSLLPFTLAHPCAYAFMGIFYVVKFEASSTFQSFNVSVYLTQL